MYFKARVLAVERSDAWENRPRAVARRLREEGQTLTAIAGTLQLPQHEVVVATRCLRLCAGEEALLPRLANLPVEESMALAKQRLNLQAWEVGPFLESQVMRGRHRIDEDMRILVISSSGDNGCSL